MTELEKTQWQDKIKFVGLVVFVALALIFMGLYTARGTRRYTFRATVDYAEDKPVGDCGVVLYPIPESGAAGYCYVFEALPTAGVYDVLYRGRVVFTATPVATSTDPTGTDSTSPTDAPPTVAPTDVPADVPTDVPTDPPAPVPTEEPTKVHCNNGGGNGSEGCNASDKGHNDEPTPDPSYPNP